MKFETLSNIINDLYYENDIDEIRVCLRLANIPFGHDVVSSDLILVCRDLANSEDELQRVINDVLLIGIGRLTNTKYENAYDLKIIEVSISPSYIFEHRIDVVATLGTVGGTLII